MNCEQCQNPIDPDRVKWSQDKGFTVKYCKSCSEKKKEQKAQSGGYTPGGGSRGNDPVTNRSIIYQSVLKAVGGAMIQKEFASKDITAICRMLADDVIKYSQES